MNDLATNQLYENVKILGKINRKSTIFSNPIKIPLAKKHRDKLTKKKERKITLRQLKEEG